MALDTVLSALTLAVIALVVGAIALWRRSGMTRQVWLMLLLAAVAAGNLAIWLVPDGSGKAPVEQARE
jgi:uncharacterized membrane protein YqaE (UPF0057 family)